LIYLDSCLLIYIVEKVSPWLTSIERAMHAAGGPFAISPLVEMECLVGPLRAGNQPLADEYRRLFATLQGLSFADACFRDAASIRARSGLKSIDALHLACAQHHRCTDLWTNDHRLSAAGAGLVRVLSP
jgi:predicted nucleic acid-binding protein